VDGVRGEDHRESHVAFVGRKTTREENKSAKRYGQVREWAGPKGGRWVWAGRWREKPRGRGGFGFFYFILNILNSKTFQFEFEPGV
jgi:hypothetical protein